MASANAVTGPYESGSPLVYTPRYDSDAGGRCTGSGPVGSEDLLKTMIPIAIAATAMIAAPIVTIRRRFPGSFPRPCLIAPFLR